MILDKATQQAIAEAVAQALAGIAPATKSPAAKAPAAPKAAKPKNVKFVWTELTLTVKGTADGKAISAGGKLAIAGETQAGTNYALPTDLAQIGVLTSGSGIWLPHTLADGHAKLARKAEYAAKHPAK